MTDLIIICAALVVIFCIFVVVVKIGMWLIDDPDYAAIYRKANPRTMPYNIHCRQPELSDLWPVDQQKFKRIVDAARRKQKICNHMKGLHDD